MAVTNIVRVVYNSSNGQWYGFERAGDRFVPLPATGIALTATAEGTNRVDVYRINDERGAFQAMVASAEKPATLRVNVKDTLTGNLVEKESVTATAFGTDHIAFVLAGSYAANAGQEVSLDFKDGTVGTVTPSVAALALYEKRETDQYGVKEGTWRILSADVADLDDKRVDFKSTNPSVARIERGKLTDIIAGLGFTNLADLPQQTDQYCVVIGVRAGACKIRCGSVADPSKYADVDVTVVLHPDDEPLISGGDLAAEASALLHNVRIPVSMVDSPTWRSLNAYSPMNVDGPGPVLFMRSFVLPGSVDDHFDIELNFAGTIPAQHGNYAENVIDPPPGNCVLAFAVGLQGSGALGVPSTKVLHAYHTDGPPETWYDHEGYALNLLDTMGCESALLLNDPVSPWNSGPSTQTINKNVAFSALGGETIVLCWALDVEYGCYPPGIPGSGRPALPDGIYECLMTVVGVTHHGPTEET